MSYESPISHYMIYVSKSEMGLFDSLLSENKAISPEWIGVLIGRAKAVYKPTKPIS